MTLASGASPSDSGAVAIATGDESLVNPPAESTLPVDGELVLIGDSESEHRFLTRYEVQAGRRSAPVAGARARRR